jgi:hypothetical protein
MLRVSTFPGLHTVPWIVLTLQCLHHGIGRSYNILSLAGRNSAGISENSADASATTVQNTRFSRYFAQRCVLHFHDCAHGDGLRRRQECYRFRRFLDSAVPWIARRLECLHHWIGRSHNIYFLWMGEEFAGISETRRCVPLNSDSLIFRSTMSPHFHDCAHGDSLRRRQECHGFRRFLDSARCHG